MVEPVQGGFHPDITRQTCNGATSNGKGKKPMMEKLYDDPRTKPSKARTVLYRRLLIFRMASSYQLKESWRIRYRHGFCLLHHIALERKAHEGLLDDVSSAPINCRQEIEISLPKYTIVQIFIAQNRCSIECYTMQISNATFVLSISNFYDCSAEIRTMTDCCPRTTHCDAHHTTPHNARISRITPNREIVRIRRETPFSSLMQSAWLSLVMNCQETWPSESTYTLFQTKSTKDDTLMIPCGKERWHASWY